MKRRELLRLAALCGMAPLAPWLQAQGMRVRRAADDPAAAQDLAAFDAAVRTMRNVADATSPDSWDYWANVHGVTAQVPAALQGIWGTCDHGAHFLAWHRIYLVFFEAAVAKASGKADFAMPYWNWFRSLDVPPRFATPELESNGLWRAGRGYARKYNVSPDVLGAAPAYDRFNQRCFGNPHSNIHLNFQGEMARPSTAARDPVFWPHHVAMDRLWEMWLSNPNHRNPAADGAWAARRFRFLTSGNGMAAKDVLQPAQLGYRYDDLSIAGQDEVAQAPPVRPERIEAGTAVANPQESTAGAPAIVAEKGVTALDGSSLTVRMPLPPAAAGGLEAIGAAGGAATSLVLRLEGVTLTDLGARTGALYDIYVNLPVGDRARAQGAASPRSYYVGQVNSFGLGMAGHHGEGHVHASTVDFELDQLVPALKVAGAWNPGLVEINLVEPAGQRASGPLIRIERMRLLLGRKP